VQSTIGSEKLSTSASSQAQGTRHAQCGQQKRNEIKDVFFYVVSDLFPDDLLVSLASAGSTAENRPCCRNKPVAYVETAMEKTV